MMDALPLTVVQIAGNTNTQHAIYNLKSDFNWTIDADLLFYKCLLEGTRCGLWKELIIRAYLPKILIMKIYLVIFKIL